MSFLPRIEEVIHLLTDKLIVDLETTRVACADICAPLKDPARQRVSKVDAARSINVLHRAFEILDPNADVHVHLKLCVVLRRLVPEDAINGAEVDAIKRPADDVKHNVCV